MKWPGGHLLRRFRHTPRHGHVCGYSAPRHAGGRPTGPTQLIRIPDGADIKAELKGRRHE